MQTDDETKTKEEILQELTEYRAIFEISGSSIVITDNDGTINRVNTEFVNLFGYSKEEIEFKQKWTELCMAEDRDRVNNYHRLRRIDPASAPHNYEARFVQKNGSLIDIYVSAGMIPETKESVLAIINITDRKQAEEAYREANDYLENLLNYANAPIIVWDPDYKIIRFNKAFERLTGYSADRVLGKSLEILFPDAQKDKSMALIRRTATGERWETVEIDIAHVGRTVRTVFWNSATLFAADGTTIVATIAQGQDITERKQAEDALRESHKELELRVKQRTIELKQLGETKEALRKSEERYRQIVETATEGIWVIDSTCKTTFANKKMAEMLACTAKEMIGKLFYDFIYDKWIKK
ncbi:MAG: PAS domain S-box protein, partial [Desulfotomaculaceae bacterium]